MGEGENSWGCYEENYHKFQEICREGENTLKWRWRDA